MQYQYLLRGELALQNQQKNHNLNIPNLPPHEITAEQWSIITKLHILSPLFDDLHNDIIKHSKSWEAWLTDQV